jgi:hypothetical protein
MADTADKHAEAHPIAQHDHTWAFFKNMMYWGTIGCALVGAIVVFLIAS